MSLDAELLGVAGNFAVVQLSHRRFPGLLMQGDTLHSIMRDLQSARQAATSRDHEELMSSLLMLEEQLSGALDVYEKVCLERNQEMPYMKHDSLSE